MIKYIANSDAHHRLFIAAVLSGIVAVCLGGGVSLRAHVFVTWNFFSFCMLAMAWIGMITTKPQTVRRTARLQDSSRTAIFVFVIVSACASLLALAVLLGTAKGLSREKLIEHILLSVGTVLCSWLLVHTVFALRYAHLYYGAGRTAKSSEGAGLEFPGEKEPDYMDFAYFAFVVGMTCQVSDVQISGRRIRRLALVHGVISFAFNTVILALTINIISGLL